MDVVDLVGRIVFAALFWQNGWNHLRHRAGTVAFARTFRAPYPEVTVPLTGAVMVVAATLIAIGVWADLAALALAVFVVVAAYYAHAYWKETDPYARAAQQAQFMKNIAIAGACLFLLALFQQFHDGMKLTLGGSFF